MQFTIVFWVGSMRNHLKEQIKWSSLESQQVKDWCCHCSSLGCSWGSGSIPGPGFPYAVGAGKKKKNPNCLWLAYCIQLHNSTNSIWRSKLIYLYVMGYTIWKMFILLSILNYPLLYLFTQKKASMKKFIRGVPTVAQWVKNLTAELQVQALVLHSRLKDWGWS